jgi:TrmH family RNA methyltransferase
MLSNTQSKYIRSLTQQKYRKQHNVFLAEGDKIAREWLISGNNIKIIAGTDDWLAANEQYITRHKAEVITVTEAELERISALQTPNKALLVVEMPQQQTLADISSWCIALQQVQDPGNMGTIIRIADWFGIRHVVCSADCVDVYNPKVVQAAMGGHLRVNILSVDMQQFLNTTHLPVLAATLHGTSIYDMPRMDNGIILIGNESKGLPNDILAMATHRVTIPRLGGAESLNAGVSAGIITALLVGR